MMIDVDIICIVTRETSNGATIAVDQIGKSLSSKSNGLFAVGGAVSSVPPAPAPAISSKSGRNNNTRLHKPQKSARAQAVLEAHGNDFYNNILRNDLNLGDSDISQIAKLAGGHVDIRAAKNKGLAIHDQLRYNQYQGQAQVQAQAQTQAQQLQQVQQQQQQQPPQQQQQSLTINANGIQGLNNGNTSINGFASYNATNNNGNHYNYNKAALPPATTATASASTNGYNSLLTPRVNNYNNNNSNNNNNNNGNNFNYMNYNTNNLNVAAIGQAMHNYYHPALNAAVNAYASAACMFCW